MEIRSISFHNARTPVVNCLVQNVSVDITVNQVGRSCSNHLRVVLAPKCCCWGLMVSLTHSLTHPPSACPCLSWLAWMWRVQTGSLASLAFLEEADRAIGSDHLFKRSLLLLKVRAATTYR